jgi:uncharacterized protein (DUF1810 family)
MTLFAGISEDGSVFHQMIEHYFYSELDTKTVDIVKGENL